MTNEKLEDMYPVLLDLLAAAPYLGLMYVAYDVRKRNLPASSPVSSPSAYQTMSQDMTGTIKTTMANVQTVLTAVKQTTAPSSTIQPIVDNLNDIYNALKSLLP